MLKSQMHDILILFAPVELVGMLKSQQMHDILTLTEPVGWGRMQNHNLNARYLNSHWTSGVGGNAKITT
jgi:hypothetical protein